MSNRRTDTRCRSPTMLNIGDNQFTERVIFSSSEWILPSMNMASFNRWRSSCSFCSAFFWRCKHRRRFSAWRMRLCMYAVGIFWPLGSTLYHRGVTFRSVWYRTLSQLGPPKTWVGHYMYVPPTYSTCLSRLRNALWNQIYWWGSYPLIRCFIDRIKFLIWTRTSVVGSTISCEHQPIWSVRYQLSNFFRRFYRL